MSRVSAASPFVVHPQQVRAQDDRDVPRRHLVHVLMLRQLGQEFDQVPDGRGTRSAEVRSGRSSEQGAF